MDFLSKVVEKCSNFMINNVGYLIYYNRNIKSLDKESDKLDIIRNEMWLLHCDVELRQKVGNSVDDPSLHDIAKEVAKECKGLPIVIVTVARELKFNSRPSWEGALVELERSAPRNIPGVIENVYQPLKECYNHIESDEAKYLFLMYSFFEEDSDILPEQLLRKGMELGIFSEIENFEHARNRMCLLLETLKDRFLLSQGSNSNYVKMPDVVRDVAINIASECKHIFMASHF
uniref:Disease resistance protein RPS2 n=1 Tax=Solanum tuberosum TaxID=4113 RepID=M1CPQ2_SOLTU